MIMAVAAFVVLLSVTNCTLKQGLHDQVHINSVVQG